MLLTLLAVIVLAGCAASPKPLYHYGDYSDSYYAYKKNMTEESSLKLQKAIEEAIAAAGESRSGRVPPGMYANIGYMYLKNGSPKKAIESFEKEKSVYPESTQFMDRIIQKVNQAEGDNK